MILLHAGDGTKKGPAYRCTRDRYSGWFDPFGNAKFRMFLAILQDAHILAIGMSPKEFPRLNVRQDTHGTNISSIPQAILAFYIYRVRLCKALGDIVCICFLEATNVGHHVCFTVSGYYHDMAFLSELPLTIS